MSSQSLCGYEMKRFIILACLVAAQFAHGAHVKTIRQKLNKNSFEDSVQLELEKLNGELQRCIVTTNKGEEFIVYQKGLPDHLPINITFDKFLKNRVKIKNPTVDLNGKWSVKQTFSFNKSQETKVLTEEFYIQMKDIFQRKEVIPAKWIDIYEGNYAIFKIPEYFPNLKSCILEDKDKNEYDVLSEEYSHLKIQEHDVCGVRIPVNKTFSGYLYLYADVRTNETYFTSININIKEQNDFNLQLDVLYLQLGEEESIKYSRSSESITYCQLEDPNGKKLPIQAKSCFYQIPFVTKLHEGLWKVYYGVKGSNTPLIASIRVVTFDNPSLNSTVTYVQNKYIQLLCRVRGYEVDYCGFTRPDNLTFSVSPGVGNERYEYYGAGYHQGSSMFPESYDCGLTIRSPIKEDFGAWKCLIYKNNKITGTILRTDNLSKIFSKESIRTYGSKVYVPKGNSFTLKCSAEAVLNYCWMLSPNGTVHTVSKKGSSPSDLTYEGSGLEFGECGAVVEAADDTHLGEWRCRMGILNGTEVETSISVTVTDSLLIADKNMIDISSKKPTILNCRIIPGYENVINYCRWIRPDGHGIYNNVDNQYVTEKMLSSCKLTIQDLNVKFDVGSWFCVAGISGREMIEATTQIQIKYSYMGLGSIISVALSIALFIIITVTLFVIIVRKRNNIYLDKKDILVK